YKLAFGECRPKIRVCVQLNYEKPPQQTSQRCFGLFRPRLRNTKDSWIRLQALIRKPRRVCATLCILDPLVWRPLTVKLRAASSIPPKTDTFISDVCPSCRHSVVLVSGKV